MERPLGKIRKDLYFVTSNKLSSNQSILMFIGLTLEIVLRKDLFNRNSELKNFVEDLYISKTEKKQPFRDYLYLSRTLLASRLNRLVLEELTYTDIIDICRKIEKILPEEVIQRKNKNSSVQDDAVSEWMNFIGKK